MFDLGLVWRLVAAALAVIVVVGCTRAVAFAMRSDPAANAEKVEPDAAGELAPLLEEIRAKHKLPALAAAFVDDREIRSIGAVGVRKAGGTEAVSVDDPFHLGSCTKAMTATLLARLVDDGVLKWTTSVGEVFDDFPMKDGWAQVTLRQLLQHRGGAPANLHADGLWARLWQFEGTPRQARDVLVRGVLSTVPGELGRYVYSNAGYAIAGAMAERLMDEPWEELMRARVFEPLGMHATGFGPPGSEGAVDAPLGHDARGRSMEPVAAADNPPAIGPAGTVHSTLADWGRFAALHLSGGVAGERLVSEQSMRELHAPAEGPGESYALGWIVVERSWAKVDEDGRGVALTHAGSNNLWYAVAWLAPERGVGILVATNQGGNRAARACDEVAIAIARRYLLQAQPAQ